VSTLLITRGNTVTFLIKVLNAGQAMDLTGCKLWFTAKRRSNDPGNLALLRKSSDNGDFLLIANIGQAYLTLQPSDTHRLQPNNPSTLYFFEVQVQDARGYIYTAVTGRLQVLPRLTDEPCSAECV
jgi:hypothetical protein